jgi:acetate kinase
VVHGGPDYTHGVRVTPEVKARLAAVTELAPLHTPVNLEGIEAAEAAWPNVPHVAVFDTAFHATLPAAAQTYPVPSAWTQDWQVRRYGFHGLSHAILCGAGGGHAGRAAGPAALGGIVRETVRVLTSPAEARRGGG